ncbi:MAG: type 1 glutamine amidotransferase domain-containing protein [Actinomycetota bacterium]
MRIALLAADMFEDVELWYPYYRLLEAGHQVDIVGCEAGATHKGKKGTSVETTHAAADVAEVEYSAVVIPGGFSPDYMRRCRPLVDLVRSVGQAGQTVAAVCHGPWMLASAGLARDRRVTSYPSIRVDLEHAGGNWVDEEVVEDGNVITSRRPDDLPAFMRTVIAALERQPAPLP